MSKQVPILISIACIVLSIFFWSEYPQLISGTYRSDGGDRLALSSTLPVAPPYPKAPFKRADDSQSQPPLTRQAAVQTPPREPISTSSAVFSGKVPGKEFRIFVHKLPGRFDHEELVKHHPRCADFQWANDLRLARSILQGPHRTNNVEKADFFLVPFLAKCWFNFVAKYNMDRMARDMHELLQVLRQTESWKRHPERHIFTFVSGSGPTLFRRWQSIRLATFVLAEGDRAAGFYDDRRDVIIPGVSVVKPPTSAKDPHRPRRLLVSFRGNLVNHLRSATGKDQFRRSLLRQALVVLAKGRPDVVVGDRVYIEADRKTYLKELDESTFCLIPRGVTPWTRRLFDALLSDCIPVVLSNSIVFPFERTLDYSGFTLKIPEAWLDQLWFLLAGIRPEQVRKLQRRVREVAPQFSSAKGKDPMASVLDELRARRDARKGIRQTPATRNTARTFWMPGKGIFKLDGNDANQVGPSYGAGAVPHPPEAELWKPGQWFVQLLGGSVDLNAEPPWWWKKYKAPRNGHN